jgi:hypothetical protein
VGHEILGSPLPDTLFGWVGLLIAIWAALLTMLSAAEKFVERYDSAAEVLRPYRSVVVPVGWVLWCVVLMIDHRDPISVLAVLIGTLMIAVTGRTLANRYRA